jgi:hypothetical protein
MFRLSRHSHPGSALTFDYPGVATGHPIFYPFTLRYQSSKGSKIFKVLPAHSGIAPQDRVSEAFYKGITPEWQQPSQKHSIQHLGLQMDGL